MNHSTVDELKFYVHKIKGNAGALKFKTLLTKCKEFESNGDDKLIEKFKDLKLLLDEYAELCEDYINQH